MRANFTENFVTTVGPGYHFDTGCAGLGCYVGKSGSRSYFSQTDYKDDSGRTKSRRSVFAKVGEVTLKEARRQARSQIDALRSNAVNAPHGALTVARAFDAYAAWLEKQGKSESHITETRRIMQHDFGDWAGRLLVLISKADCEDLHAAITARPAPMAANRAMVIFRAVWNHAKRKDRTNAFSGRSCPVGSVDMNRKPKGWQRPTVDDIGEIWAAVWQLENKSRACLHALMVLTGMRGETARNLRMFHIQGEMLVISAEYMKSRREWRRPITDKVREVLDLAVSLSNHDEIIFPTFDKAGNVIPVANLREKNHPILSGQLGHKLRRHYYTTAELAEIPQAFVDLLVDHAPKSALAHSYRDQSKFDEALMHYAQKVEGAILEKIEWLNKN